MKKPAVFKKVACAACFGFTVVLLVTVLFFAFALKPHAQAFGGGQWWSWLLAVLVVILESGLVAGFLLFFTHSKAQSEIFVTTMREQGKWKEGEMSKPSVLKEINCCKRAFFVSVITFPLNLIPFLGTALYAAINATYVGWDYMDMYFHAIHMDSKSQRVEVFGPENSQKRNLLSPLTYDDDNQYARFGFVCGMLEAIPFVGPSVFPLVNACAAGLFACDIEACGGPASLKSDSKTKPLNMV